MEMWLEIRIETSPTMIIDIIQNNTFSPSVSHVSLLNMRFGWIFSGLLRTTFADVFFKLNNGLGVVSVFCFLLIFC